MNRSLIVFIVWVWTVFVGGMMLLEIGLSTISFLITLIVSLVLSFIFIILLARQKERLDSKLIRVFGVNEDDLTSFEAQKGLERLVAKAGSLMLVQEILQGQIYLRLLSQNIPGLEPLVCEYRRMNYGRALQSLKTAIHQAREEVRRADDLYKKTDLPGIAYLFPRREDDLIDIAAMPPYNSAEWARSETRRRKDDTWLNDL